MMQYVRHDLDSPDASTGKPYAWDVLLEDGRHIAWRGLQTGPVTLTPQEIEKVCHFLLGCSLDDLPELAERVLRPATGARADRPALILHSTTPELKTFDGDLDALLRGQRGGDFTTYKEARSVYLARPGDVAVGRTRAWRAAVEAMNADAVELENGDHYYLSHALLYLACEALSGEPVDSINRLVEHVRETPRVVRLYAIEVEMQIFLIWLARRAGLEELALEANDPALSAAWNRKAVLYPAVEMGLALTEALANAGPELSLEIENAGCKLKSWLHIDPPSLPGYTLERRDATAEDFVRQALGAASLLRERYGLTKGCLKASESGDGARITPGIDLEDRDALARLAKDAHRHGDDYVLEAHVDYLRATIAGQTLPTAVSAHIRGGRVAPGATIQFMQGTSWKGNVLLDETNLDLFSIPEAHYLRLRRFVDDFQKAFERQSPPGLVLAGIDFAIGTIGGHFGDEILLGVQDLNVSFTGAECLRAFLDRASLERAQRARNGRGEGSGEEDSNGTGYGVTRIYRPRPDADHAAFQRVTDGLTRGEVYADTVASIPGRWAMVGVTGADPEDAIENLNRLQEALLAEDLVEPL